MFDGYPPRKPAAHNIHRIEKPSHTAYLSTSLNRPKILYGTNLSRYKSYPVATLNIICPSK